MNTAQRRTEILKLLHQAEKPVAARALAAQFGVSRQVIVQDMAVIRASTPGILSTTKGYVLQQDKDSACTREFKSPPWTGTGSRGTESDRRLRRPCKKYQYQPQSLWACQCGNGHSIQTG